MKRVNCAFISGLIGLFCFLMGIGFLWFGTRNLIKMWAWEKLTLKNGSEAMLRWTRLPKPGLLKVYIFNVTNPDVVTKGGLPALKEVGPYIYEISQERINITQGSNYTLFYRTRTIMKFKRKLSRPLRQSDMVTIINVPLAGAILSVSETVPEFSGLLDELWRFVFPRQTNIFITVSVRQVLFDGIVLDCSSKVTEVYIACRALETRNTYAVRKEGKNFKFSFFHAKNGTRPEVFRVHQGVLDLKTSAQLVAINNSTSVNKWQNKYCDMINGSDGAQFPVLLTKKDKIYFFEPEFCRSFYFEFEKELELNGVDVYKYVAGPSVFASPEQNPDNACFCRKPLSLRELVQDPDLEEENTDTGPKICFGNGILSLMPCVGAPVAASWPHFYMGDEVYKNYSGLTPNKELHESYAYVEPHSGITVKSYRRLQFNVEVRKVTDVQITSRVLDGLFPVIWMEYNMELSTPLFKLLRYILIQKEILEKGTFVLIALGLFLIAFSLVSEFVYDKLARKRLLNVGDGRMNNNDNDAYAKKIRSRLETLQAKNLPSVSMIGHDHNFQFLRKSMIDNFLK